MLDTLSSSLKASRRARPPLQPRLPRERVSPLTAPRRRVTVSGVPRATGCPIPPSGAPAARLRRSTQHGVSGAGAGSVPPLKPDAALFREWHGALDSVYAVIKGMLAGVSSADVHAAHSSVLLLSFEASKMAAQLRRGAADVRKLQVRSVAHAWLLSSHAWAACMTHSGTTASD